ncbi:MAG: OadG family protein [Candidatus Cloacimonadia bacterium]
MRDIKILTVVLLVLLVGGFSFTLDALQVNKEEITPNSNLIEVSEKIDIPIKTLKEYLRLDSSVDVKASISSLGVDAVMIDDAVNRFTSRKWIFSWGVVGIAMGVIFLSLIVTGTFVHLFGIAVSYFDRDKKTPARTDSESKDIKSRDTSYDAVIAAIIALHTHLKEAEESERMILAWKREPVSVWKASSKFSLANKLFGGRRGW